MSLINDALKRAQRAQVRSLPLSSTVFQAAPELPRSDKKPLPWMWAASCALAALVSWCLAVYAHVPGARRTESQALAVASSPRLATEARTAVRRDTGTLPNATPLGMNRSNPSPSAAAETRDIQGQRHNPAKLVAAVEVSVAPKFAEKVTNELPAIKMAAALADPARLISKPADSIIYVVKPRDTLSRIAKQHGTTAAAIQAINRLKSERIIVGQRLTLREPKVQSSGG